MSIKPEEKISLKKVAALSGVNASTVSRILNRRTTGFSVRPEVRQRVLAAAAELNYRPDVMAQSLRKSNMGMVGLLNVHTALHYTEGIIVGLLSILEPQGIKLSACYEGTTHTKQPLPPWRIDGAVIVSALSQDDVAPIERAGLPYVSINGWQGALGVAVNMDDVGGTRQAMQHLLELGHRRIAYANPFGPWNTHRSVKERHDTYIAALHDAGLSPAPLHDIPVEETAFDQYVQQAVVEGKATAVVAYHSYHAVGIWQAACRLGIRVPQQLSIVSLHDEYPLQFLHPTITAIDMPFQEAGRLAGRMLVERLTDAGLPGSVVTLPEKLIVRESTCRPEA